MPAMIYWDGLDAQPLPGVSLYFILLFFVPLAVTVFLAFVFVTRTRRWAKILTVLWVLAWIPASFMMLMGAAFWWKGWHQLVGIPVFLVAGAALIWLPMLFKELLLKAWDARRGKP